MDLTPTPDTNKRFPWILRWLYCLWNQSKLVERQMAEIWQDCAVCHTSMKFCWDVLFCIIIKMWCSAKLNSWNKMIHGVFKSVVHASLHVFLWKEKKTKNFISDKQKRIHRNKERTERIKMNYCITVHVSWKWNYGGLKFILEEAFVYCACATSFFSFWSVVSYDSCVVWGR